MHIFANVYIELDHFQNVPYLLDLVQWCLKISVKKFKKSLPVHQASLQYFKIIGVDCQTDFIALETDKMRVAKAKK